MENRVLEFEPRRDDNLHKCRRESSFRRQLSLVDLDTGRETAIVRFYGSGSRAYCCVWVHHGNTRASGSAWAGGYGYHKESAAMDSALRIAGFTFAEYFDGVGEIGERAALEAIAAHFNIVRFTIIHAHP